MHVRTRSCTTLIVSLTTPLPPARARPPLPYSFSDIKCDVGYYNANDYNAISAGTLTAAVTCTNPDGVPETPVAATTTLDW